MLQSLWSTLAFIFDFDLLKENGWRLMAGLKITPQVMAISCSIGFFLAYPLCMARMSRNWIVSSATLCFVTFFRGTPLLCQLYLVYYGAGQIRPFLTDYGVWWFFRDAYFCCIFTFTLNTAAYQAEIMRGALSAVPKGQTEAAKALGLSRYRIARHVVWPQAMLLALRPLGNELILMLKASALAAVITVLDLMGQTRIVFARTFDFSIYLYAALIYLILAQTIRRICDWVERALSRHLHLANRKPGTVTVAGAKH